VRIGVALFYTRTHTQTERERERVSSVEKNMSSEI
jgi:hypothetical protein